MTFLNFTSSSWIDKKYIGSISCSLDKFVWLNADTANFRCPYCGDSKKSASKRRGYFFKYKTSFRFKCQNCSTSRSISNFLSELFPVQYKEYRIELLKDGGDNKLADLSENSQLINNSTLNVIETEPRTFYYDQSIDLLPEDHPAKIYCRERKIPEKAFSRIFYTKNFKEWIVDVLAIQKYSRRNLPEDERLLLCMKTVHGEIFGVQGRSLDPRCKSRYITIKKNDLDQKIFGLENIDFNSPVFAVEGPIDSLFLPNCIAFCGGDVKIPVQHNKNNVYVLLDNEPRNKDTIIRMSKAIEAGYNVMFWDCDTRYKDINDMIKNGGYTTKDILKQVKERSKQGVAAKAELTYWKKI